MDVASSKPEDTPTAPAEAPAPEPTRVSYWTQVKTRFADTAMPAGARAARWAAAHKEWLTAAGLGLALLWCYWPTLGTMAERWWQDPQYSHGFLVPLFALAVLVKRSAEWKDRTWQPSALGLLLLAAGIFLRLQSAQIDNEFLDAFSLLPMLAGTILLVGGKSMLRWAWPGVAFLLFMVPLPYVLDQMLSQPLRRLATWMSTYLLETLGYPAIAEGNVILIEDIPPLNVADACSGLGMLTTFFALATAFAMMIKNAWVDKVLLIASAIPIALLANVLRITATGSAGLIYGREAMPFMHDTAGLFMMPVALFLLWLELLLLERLFVELDDEAPLRVAGGS